MILVYGARCMSTYAEQVADASRVIVAGEAGKLLHVDL